MGKDTTTVNTQVVVVVDFNHPLDDFSVVTCREKQLAFIKAHQTTNPAPLVWRWNRLRGRFQLSRSAQPPHVNLPVGASRIHDGLQMLARESELGTMCNSGT
eukprot:scaffold98083_cov31-Tisochrysis_lutea.AAC.2